jgi:hypothetical protein
MGLDKFSHLIRGQETKNRRRKGAGFYTPLQGHVPSDIRFSYKALPPPSSITILDGGYSRSKL